MEVSEIARSHWSREVESYNGCSGPDGRLHVRGGFVEITTHESITSVVAVWDRNYGRKVLAHGAYMCATDSARKCVRDGFPFGPSFDPTRPANWEYFEENDSWRRPVPMGEFRILPFVGDSWVLAFVPDYQFSIVDVDSNTLDRFKAHATGWESFLIESPRITLLWKGTRRNFTASSHPGELASCRIDEQMVVLLIPHEAPSDKHPRGTVAVEVVSGLEVKRVAVCPLSKGLGDVWSYEGPADFDAIPTMDSTSAPPTSTWAREADPEQDAHVAGASRGSSQAQPPRAAHNRSGLDPQVRRCFGRFLVAMAAARIGGALEPKGIGIRRQWVEQFARLAELGVRVRGRGNALRLGLEGPSRIKLLGGPRTLRYAVNCLRRHSPLMCIDEAGEQVFPFDELHRRDSELARWVIQNFPDEASEDAGVRVDSEPPAPPPPRAEPASPPSPSPPSQAPDSDGAAPAAPVDRADVEKFWAAHHERERCEAQEGPDDDDDPMKEKNLYYQPIWSEPTGRGTARGPPKGDK